jgi:hypothetical protein
LFFIAAPDKVTAETNAVDELTRFVSAVGTGSPTLAALFRLGIKSRRRDWIYIIRDICAISN